MEVIYTGLHQTPEQIVDAAMQEDVDVVALSVLSGAHMTLFPDVFEKMKARGIGDRLLTGGGIIPPEDMATLSNLGVGRLFGPGSSTQDIAHYIRGWFRDTTGEEPYAAPPAPLEAPRLPEMSAREHAARHPKPAAKAAAPAKRKPAKKAARKKAAKPARKAAKKAPARKKPAAKQRPAAKKPARRAKRR
jgi:methylmalonyl-CoA mutase C-terminal domain/subunit